MTCVSQANLWRPKYRFLASKDEAIAQWREENIFPLVSASCVFIAFILCECCLHYKLSISPHRHIPLHFLGHIGLAEVHITCSTQAHRKESHWSGLPFLSGMHSRPLLALPLHLRPSPSPTLPCPLKKVALVLYKWARTEPNVSHLLWEFTD